MTASAYGRPSVREWVVVLGAAWFMAGFVGPMIVAPGANQGPMAGIFITGPLGVIAGAILGGLAALLDLRPQSARKCLYGLASIGVVAIVYFVIPSPRMDADIIEGTLEQCASPATLRADTAAAMQAFSERHFAALGKSNPWTPSAWERRFDELLANEGGVVLKVHTNRVARQYRGAARWDEDRLTTSPWLAVDRHDTVYAESSGSDCRAFPPVGTRVRYRLRGLINIWEPRTLPELMNVYRAEPM